MSQSFHVKLFIPRFIVHKAIVLFCHPKQTQFTSVYFRFTPMSKDIYCSYSNANRTLNAFCWPQPKHEPLIKVPLFANVDKIQMSDHSFCLFFFFTLFGTTFSYSPAVQSGSRTGLKIILESAASSSTDRDLGLGIYRLHRKLPKTFLQAL